MLHTVNDSFTMLRPLRPSLGENETSPSAADLSRTFGFDLPAIVIEQNHAPDPGDCCARSGGRFGTQQKNPALWRGFSGYG